jgi:hypothetical protein
MASKGPQVELIEFKNPKTQGKVVVNLSKQKQGKDLICNLKTQSNDNSVEAFCSEPYLICLI